MFQQELQSLNLILQNPPLLGGNLPVIILTFWQILQQHWHVSSSYAIV